MLLYAFLQVWDNMPVNLYWILYEANNVVIKPRYSFTNIWVIFPLFRQEYESSNNEHSKDVYNPMYFAATTGYQF